MDGASTDRQATQGAVITRAAVAVACAAAALPARMVESLPWAVLFAAPPLLAALLVGLTAWRRRFPAHLLAAAAVGLVLAPVAILQPDGLAVVMPAVAAVGSATIAWSAVRAASQPPLSALLATLVGLVSLVACVLAFGAVLGAANFAQCGPPTLAAPGTTLVCWT